MELEIKNPTLKFDHDILKILQKSNYDNVDMDVNTTFTLLNDNLKNRYIEFRNEIIDILKYSADVCLVNKLQNKELFEFPHDIINLLYQSNDNTIFDCNDIQLLELVIEFYNDIKNMVECYDNKDYSIETIRNKFTSYLNEYNFNDTYYDDDFNKN